MDIPLASPSNVGCVCRREGRDNAHCNWRSACKQLDDSNEPADLTLTKGEARALYDLLCLGDRELDGAPTFQHPELGDFEHRLYQWYRFNFDL